MVSSDKVDLICLYMCKSDITVLALICNIRELKRATFLSHGRQPEVCCFLI